MDQNTLPCIRSNNSVGTLQNFKSSSSNFRARKLNRKIFRSHYSCYMSAKINSKCILLFHKSVKTVIDPLLVNHLCYNTSFPILPTVHKRQQTNIRDRFSHSLFFIFLIYMLFFSHFKCFVLLILKFLFLMPTDSTQKENCQFS